MALIIQQKALFLHIPKTGGTWLRHGLQRAKIPMQVVGEQHTHFPRLSAIDPSVDELFTFLILRHPVTWYQSRWLFRVQHGWHITHPLDYNCASNNFHDFMERVLAFRPTGWVTHIYGMYLDNIPGGADYVGRTENLADDSCAALRKAGVDFDEQVLRDLPVINKSNLEGLPSSYWARYTPELLQRVLEVERGIIDKYYSDYDLDADALM